MNPNRKSIYIYVPPKCSLSSFIDILYPDESRCRHFKRLETLSRYNIYKYCSTFNVVNKNVVLNEIPEYHYIVRQVRYVELDKTKTHPAPELEDYYNEEYLIEVRQQLDNTLEDILARV